jgi:hypothetical protein
MTAVLRGALVAIVAVILLPAVAPAQTASTDSLLRRIATLEQRIAVLDQRLTELEVRVKTQPTGAATVPPTPVSGGLQNWRRLRIGMRMQEVRDLLGEPERVDAGYVTYWRWDNANVRFVDGRVDGWSEPGR